MLNHNLRYVGGGELMLHGFVYLIALDMKGARRVLQGSVSVWVQG
jgi:hypothetical protein